MAGHRVTAYSGATSRSGDTRLRNASKIDAETAHETPCAGRLNGAGQLPELVDERLYLSSSKPVVNAEQVLVEICWARRFRTRGSVEVHSGDNSNTIVAGQ